MSIKVKYRDLYKNSDFMKMWAAQFISQLADRMFTYILMITAYQFSHTNLGVSIPLLSFGVPAILFSLIFGVLVDRHRKKNTMFLSNIMRFIIIMIIPGLLLLKSSLLFLFLIGAAVFTVSLLFIPAETALIPLIVDKARLILANSLFMGSWMIASVVGFALAVPIVSKFGINGTYYVIAAFYLVASLFILLIGNVEEKNRKKSSFSTIKREFRAGVRFVFKHRIVFYAILQMFFSIMILAIISVLAIGFSSNVLNIPATDFGYLVAVSGVGMGVGIVFISRMLRSLTKYQIINIGFLLIGSMLFCLGNSTTLPEALFFIFCMGIGNAFLTAPLQTIIQERTPKVIHGKVFSVQNMFNSIAYTIPPVIAGYATDLLGYRLVFSLLGIFSVILMFSIKKIK